MPYRIHFPVIDHVEIDRLIDLGAIDVDESGAGGVTALMPDSIPPQRIAHAIARHDFTVSPALARDAGSVWILGPRSFRVGRLRVAPSHADPQPGALRLIDAPAFGTGLHPTTALCLEVIDELAQTGAPARVLDVGTGSGILALAALSLGVPRATAIDIDAEAVRAAAENARLNGLRERLQLVHGGVDALCGAWPLVLANVLAAPLIEMAPLLVRRVGHRGRLVLSGIPHAVAEDVSRAYRHLGMHPLGGAARGDWRALLLQASW